MRLAALETVSALVGVVQAQSCSTYLAYIVEAVLHYLEDADPVMQEKAQETLMSYASLNPEKFLACVTKHQQRGTSGAMERCQKLLEHARSLPAREQ